MPGPKLETGFVALCVNRCRVPCIKATNQFPNLPIRAGVTMTIQRTMIYEGGGGGNKTEFPIGAPYWLLTVMDNTHRQKQSNNHSR